MEIIFFIFYFSVSNKVQLYCTSFLKWYDNFISYIPNIQGRELRLYAYKYAFIFACGSWLNNIV